jgi:hypothetical protein
VKELLQQIADSQATLDARTSEFLRIEHRYAVALERRDQAKAEHNALVARLKVLVNELEEP